MRIGHFPKRDRRNGVATAKSARFPGPRFYSGSFAPKGMTASPRGLPTISLTRSRVSGQPDRGSTRAIVHHVRLRATPFSKHKSDFLDPNPFL